MKDDTILFLMQSMPEQFKDYVDSLHLLKSSIQEMLQGLNAKTTELIAEQKYSEVTDAIQKADNIKQVNEQLQRYIEGLSPQNITKKKQDKEVTKIIPGYKECIVDNKEPHTLTEDFTYTKPYAFSIEQHEFKVNEWKQVLQHTIGYLADKNPSIIKSFVDNQKFAGKKNNYFSYNNSNMNTSLKIQSLGIWYETTFTANNIAKLVSTMLEEFHINTTDYIIYLRADYRERHRK